jgi:hypothetical protein
MRTPTNSGRVSLRVHTSPVTDATVCMRTFAPQRRDRHGPVSPKPDARTWPDRSQKPQISAPRAQRQSVCHFGWVYEFTAVASTLVHDVDTWALRSAVDVVTKYNDGVPKGWRLSKHSLDPKPGPKLIGHHATDPLRWPARSAAETVAGQIFSVDTTESNTEGYRYRSVEELTEAGHVSLHRCSSSTRHREDRKSDTPHWGNDPAITRSSAFATAHEQPTPTAARSQAFTKQTGRQLMLAAVWPGQSHFHW